MAPPPSPERLLAIIELQNAIAAAAMNADEVMHIVAARAATLTAATAGSVALTEGDEMVVRAVAGMTTLTVGLRAPTAASLAGRCVSDCAPLRIDDVATDDRLDAGTRARLGASSVICVPLLYGESPVGVLEVLSSRKAAFSDEDLETLRVLAQIIAIALHRAYTYPRPRFDSLLDALTGLGNRRAFDERIDAELARNRRYKHSFSLAMLRLGGLETAIDRFGQAAGDEILRQVSTILKAHTRAIDACFRVTADQLAIVLPGTSLEGAKILAERCRVPITKVQHCEPGGAIVASFGVVQAQLETAGDLLARATAAFGPAAG